MFETLLTNVTVGLSVALTPENLLYCFLGVFLGTLLGALPGIGTLVAVSLLFPITFHLSPTTGLVMLAGIFYGTAYGGSIASILLNVPGTPSNAIACLDGYPMARQGRAGIALLLTALSSFIGGSIAIIIMMLFSPLIATVALRFGPWEYFSLMLLGLLAASGMGAGSPLKGLAMVIIGIALGLVGTDVSTGAVRLTMGLPMLYDGISLVALATGLFGVGEVILSIRATKGAKLIASKITFRSMIPTRDDWRRFVPSTLRGTAVGSFFGALPGTGSVIASFMAYAVERRVAKEPARFGKGAVEGVVSPEAANNAADQTSFIPTLALGIPGSATMSIMLGVLMIHGIAPGPSLVLREVDLFWGLVMSFWVGNLLLLALNIPLIGIWVRMLTIPYKFLYPAILMLVCMGIYAIERSSFDVWLVLFFGAGGTILRLLGFPLAPLILGFVLGPLVEEHFRRAMLISQGDFLAVFQRPISGTICALAAVLVAFMVYRLVRDLLKERRGETVGGAAH